ncbi:TolC family protein, partial [Turicimonas muris]
DVGDMPKFKRLRALKVPAIGKGIPSKLLTERPDIVEAEENLKAANADIGAARAMYFPSISLSGGLGFSSEELHDLIKSPSRVWSVGGNITGPIFHWGAVEAGVKQAEAQQKGLVAAYRLAVSQAFADVDNALSKRQKALQELKDRTGLVASLKEYKRLATAQYQEGYTGYFTVLQAEQSLLPQQLQLAQVRANTLSSIASIYQSLGGGWIDLALQEERQAIADLEREEQLKKEIQEASPEEREENSLM